MSDFSIRGVPRPIVADEPPFPSPAPDCYESLPSEPTFDPSRHLALEMPARIWRLTDFGYDAAETAALVSRTAITAPFRLLSHEGVLAMRQVALSLRDKRQSSDRTASYLTGGVYRSRFLRDFCACPAVIDLLSRIAETSLMTHSMPSQQIYINYAPQDIEKAVDTWHTDGIGFDAVVMVSDPSTFEGGEFQFFRGTRTEAAQFLGTQSENLTESYLADLPPERIETAVFPAAGYAVFQNGAMVVHRANRLRRAAERITSVAGYVSRDARGEDPTCDVVADWEEDGIRAEFARHKAWCSRARLDALLRELPLGADDGTIRRELEWAISDVEAAIKVLKPR